MKRGSYTVEAALLMGIMVPLLVGVIYVGIYLKARGETYGKALEEAMTTALTGKTGNFTEVEKKKIRAEVKKEVPILPFGGQIFRLPRKAEAVCEIINQNPGETVFRLHSLKEVIRQVKDK